MSTILSILVVISSVVIIGAVMTMESEQAGLGTLDASEAALWGQNRGSGKKEVLNRVAIVSTVVFIIALIAMAAI